MTRKKRNSKLRYGRAILLSILIASFVLAGAGIGYFVGALRSLPPYDIDNITGDLSSIIFDKDDQEVVQLRSKEKRVELSQNEIPEIMKKAIIAIEDQRFERHHGVDLYRLGGAVVANITKGYGSQGASTITQQLVKNAILKNTEKKLRRKIQELYIALQIEGRYSKEQILTLYLNNVYYGHGAWSLQTASHLYFGKDAMDLDLAESAMLAGVVNAPTRYSPYLQPEKAKQRQSLVLNEMVKMNYISKEDAEKAKSEKFNLAGLAPNDYMYQSFIDYVIEEAVENMDLEQEDISTLYTSGYHIYTTMDAKTQETAEEAYANDKNFPAGKKDKIVQSAMVILDPHNGGIRTLIGGRNQEGERQFNRAIHATRQPGSTMKPIAVYGPALEKGYGPATVLDDYPEKYDAYGSKTFVNYNKKYRGLVSMRTALQYSINTVAVKMLQKIGVSEGFKFAESLGITTLVKSGKANDMGLSLALGGLTEGVTPLELTAAFGCFANEGVYVKPYAIRKIEDKDGNVIYKNEIMKQKVMSKQTAYLMSDMLQTVVTSGTATKARLSDRPVAGKTGTTSFDVDAWFVGYTPDLVGSVWLGYDKVEKMHNVFGGGYGAPIWKQVMTVAHKDIPASSFPKPEGIKTVPVDYKSGLLPSNLTPEKYVVQEKFNSDYVPEEVSNVWVELPVCADTGQLLTNSCPNSITNVFLKRPIPWTGDIPPEDASEEAPTEYCTVHGGIDIPLPATSIRLKGTPQTDSNGNITAIRLNWQYPDDDTSTYYQIYRSSEPNASIVPRNRVAEVSRTDTWQDNYPAKSNNIYYRVIASKSGEPDMASSNEIIIRSSKNESEGNTKLQAPRLKGEVHLDGRNSQVKLSWSKASDERPIVYYIFRSEKPNFTTNSTTQIAEEEYITETNWTDTDIKRNKVYYYKVIGIDLKTNDSSPISNKLEVKLRK